MAVNPIRTDAQALVPYEQHSHQSQQSAGGMLMPVATPEQAQRAVKAFEDMKASLASPSDMILMKGGRIFLRKPFWRRVARAFGLDVRLVSEERFLDSADGSLCYSVIYRAVAPNGAAMDGDGFCSTSELSAPTNTEHNCRARAHTRAKNRAISDLVGGGEVSADELTDAELEEVRHNTSGQSSAPRPQQQQQRRATPPATPASPAAAAAQTKMAASSGWKALIDPDVIEHLLALGISGREPVMAFMKTMKAEMEAEGLAWTRDQVLEHLRSTYVAEADNGQSDENDLSTIDTGAPGN